MSTADAGPVRELRLVVTAHDYDDAVRFYRDVLGLPERESYSSPDGRVMILEAGRATLEIADPAQAEFIDRVEVGRRVAGHIRVAFEVADSGATMAALEAAGADCPRTADPHAVAIDECPARGPGGSAAHAVHGAATRRLTAGRRAAQASVAGVELRASSCSAQAMTSAMLMTGVRSSSPSAA